MELLKAPPIGIKSLHVYCNECKTVVSKKKDNASKKVITCRHSDSQTYKAIVHIPGTKSDTLTKVLSTRSLVEAISETEKFIEQCKANGYAKPKQEMQTAAVEKPKSKPQLLIECMSAHLEHLHGIGVAKHMHRTRSKEHLSDIERCYLRAITAIKEIQDERNKPKYNTEAFLYSDMNDEIVGEIHSFFLEKAEYSPESYNRYMGFLKALYQFLIDEGYKTGNPFSKVAMIPIEEREPTVFEANEYYKLLDSITPENGIKIVSYFSKTRGKQIEERKNLYRPWLRHGAELGLNTGWRRESVAMIKFSDIDEDATGLPHRIVGYDYKVNKIKGLTIEKSMKKLYAPVTEPLLYLLYELGYEEYKGTDRYLIAGDSLCTRETIMHDLSRGINHYLNLMGLDEKRWKHFRKTNASELAAYFKGSPRGITGHANDDILYKHYLNRKAIADAAKGFRVFPAPKVA